MLRQAKLFALKAARSSGASSAVLMSSWRRSRLLILCYHGISLADEHLWNPGLYISPALFQARLQALHDHGCSVLPLGEAVERLYAGTLPERSVVLTFDDGFVDFHQHAWPMIKAFSWPVTVYLTTYYSDYNRPVFDPTCSYLAWKSKQTELQWPEIFGSSPVRLGGADSTRVGHAVKEFAIQNKLSGQEKDALLSEFAARLGVDLSDILRRRILHLMNGAEVQQVAAEGADVQLHTHRHRIYRNRPRFQQEIEDNRSRIQALTGSDPKHFCYPGGFRLPQVPQWLREFGVRTATTCDPGLASPSSDRMLLPRILDAPSLTQAEFEGWITGINSFMTRKATYMSAGQLGEDT
jgi:peptidoglycan/xylan/chitin deacetylase (PgdA/CDA1 family)